MSWDEELKSGIQQAIAKGGKRRIAVHNEEQARLGRQAAELLLYEPGILTFEVIPEHNREKISIGTILNS